MNNEQSFVRLAVWTSILAVILAFGSMIFLALAVNFNVDAFSQPSILLSIGASGARLLQWSMILDMFGYYLLLAPAALLLWNWLRLRNINLVTLYTLCGLAYILIGAIGAVILASVAPPLIEEYSKTAGPQKELVAVIFNSFINVVYIGLWNILETSLSGIWWLGIGLFLFRERPIIGIITIVLGIFSLLNALGRIVNAAIIYTVGLDAVLFLIPIWVLCLIIDLRVIKLRLPGRLPII